MAKKRKITKRESEKFVRVMLAQAEAKEIKPPFTMRFASPSGTVHTIKVAQNGVALHTVEYRKPEDVDVDLLEGMLIVEPDKTSH